MKYTDEKLISELHRFVAENGRVSIAPEMTPKNGYPAAGAYVNHFGSWNKALKFVNFELNKKHHMGILIGNESCSYCGKRADEISSFKAWRYDREGNRFCDKHGKEGKPDYVTGNLDINSPPGRGRSGEILVAKTLKIANEFDCNRISCGYKFDLIHDKYEKIDVKISVFNYIHNMWSFRFNAKKVANTYICVGLSNNKKDVKHVWIIPNIGKILNLQAFNVRDTFSSLSNRSKWEVDCKPYDKTWKSMSLDNCKIMVDKSKHVPTRTWEETLKALAELNKKYGVKSSV